MSADLRPRLLALLLATLAAAADIGTLPECLPDCNVANLVGEICGSPTWPTPARGVRRWFSPTWPVQT